MAKNKKNRKDKIGDYIKASRHGEWLANNEFATGFVSVHKAHKSKKTYTRKTKHRNKK
jgi:hypothetical protein